jgi:hypothetical protein
MLSVGDDSAFAAMPGLGIGDAMGGNDRDGMRGGWGTGGDGGGWGAGGDGGGAVGVGRLGGGGARGSGGGGGGTGYGSIGRGSRPRVSLAAGGDDAVRTFVESRMSRLQHCYQTALRGDETPGDSAGVRLGYDAAGLVVDVAVTGSGTAALDACFTRALKGRLPAEPGQAGGGGVTLALKKS